MPPSRLQPFPPLPPAQTCPNEGAYWEGDILGTVRCVRACSPPFLFINGTQSCESQFGTPLFKLSINYNNIAVATAAGTRLRVRAWCWFCGRYPEGVKLIVAAFSVHFGAATGAALRAWCQRCVRARGLRACVRVCVWACVARVLALEFSLRRCRRRRLRRCFVSPLPPPRV